jgi:hypothetical protein
MRYLRRDLESQVLKAARSFPAIVLTGPRRAGKTVLLRRLLPAVWLRGTVLSPLRGFGALCALASVETLGYHLSSSGLESIVPRT